MLIFNIDLEPDESDDIDSGMYISVASRVVTPILIFLYGFSYNAHIMLLFELYLNKNDSWRMLHYNHFAKSILYEVFVTYINLL